MSRPRRIVLVSPVAPIPLSRQPIGGRWTYALFKGLAARGHKVTMFAPCENDQQQDLARGYFPAPDFDLRTFLIEDGSQKGLRSRWRNLREPLGYMFGPDLRRGLAETLSKPWDVLHLEGAWSGWVGMPFDRSKALLSFYNLSRVDDSNQPARSLRDALWRRLRQGGESRLARAYPNLMALTDRLAAELKSLAPKSAVHVCPFGLDLSLYPFIPPETRPKVPVVTLISSMNWPPNLAAAQRLLSRLWPAIKRQVPEARCQVVGWEARKALRSYLGLADIDIHENVAEIRPYFEEASLMLFAPGRSMGMKVKVLEAFACGVPVVTTAEGAEGIPVVDGVHAELAEDDAALIEKTVRLLRDLQRQEDLRVSARAMIQGFLDPQRVIDAVERIYEALPP